jgi:hypothetical protein
MPFMQTPLLQAPTDRPPPHPKVNQLLPAHDPVLTPGQALHLPLKKSSWQLSTHTVLK